MWNYSILLGKYKKFWLELNYFNAIRSLSPLLPQPCSSLKGLLGGNTYRLAEVARAGVRALQLLTVATASTSVDGHTWRFKEGVCGCSKLLPHIYTHLPRHALCLSPLIINTCGITGKSFSYSETTMGESSEKLEVTCIWHHTKT